jgi:integrase/recombinase XerD
MANASKFLDKRFKLADGTFKVRIRVTHERKSIYLNTIYSFDEKTYKGKIEKGLNMNNNKELIDAKKDIQDLEAKANKIIKELPVFSFDGFKARYEQKGDRADLVSLLLQEAEQHKENSKFSNANIFLSASNLFKRYAIEKYKTETLNISMITPDELRSFQSWAEKKYSITTISMYLVRTQKVFNNLIRSGEISKSLYPFGPGLYKIPQSINSKRPLTLDEIELLIAYQPASASQEFAKSMFLFSYLCGGMNMADIFSLRNSDICDDRITFVRRKTKAKTSKTQTIRITPEISEILAKHKVHNLHSDYVFKVFNAQMTEFDKHKAKDAAILAINRSLKAMAKTIGLPLDISTYYARHSFATILMESEVPLAFISQKLGHADLKTTQNYLSQFSKEKEEQYMSSLLKKIV